MKARYARQIRHGLWLARVHGDIYAAFGHPIQASALAGLSDLEYRAYHRAMTRRLAQIRTR